MNRKITIAVILLLCLYLDSIFFANVNWMDMRPDAMLAAVVSIAVLTGSSTGAVMGGIGGLVMDMFVGRYIGITAIFGIIAGTAAGFFYKKFYADNIVVPAASAVVLCFIKNLLLEIVVLISGGKAPFGPLLLRYILPASILTGALCALMHLVFKPLLARQVKRGQV